MVMLNIFGKNALESIVNDTRFKTKMSGKHEFSV